MKPFELMLGDCLERMQEIPDGSVDMILCDLPYGTTACKWDTVIPFEPLWTAYRRVTKKNAAIVLTASTPFDKVLGCSNLPMLKYEWIWCKNRGSGFLNAKKKPLKFHENVLVFYSAPPTYNPQKFAGKKNNATGAKEGQLRTKRKPEICNGSFNLVPSDETGMKYPRSTLPIDGIAPTGFVHPTQKPVALMEYLIKTYTNPGELVLDNTMGSGTTGVACMNTGRRFIGIERDPAYFAICEDRISKAFMENYEV